MINDLKRDKAESGYDELATAIVQQACFDYVDSRVQIEYLKTPEALDRYKKHKGVRSRHDAKERIEMEIDRQNCMLNDCRRFFKSQWFQELCSLDGNYIMKILEEKAMNRINGRTANRIIKNMMKKKGINQSKLARMIGCSDYYVSKMLRRELPNKEKKKLYEIIKNCS